MTDPVYRTSSGTVIDREVLLKKSSAELIEIFEAVRYSANRVLVVDRAATFFTVNNMIKLIEANNPDYVLISDKLDKRLTLSQIEAIQTAVSLKNTLLDNAPNPTNYTFETIVPEGWAFEDNYEIYGNGKYIKRTNALEGQRYSATLAQAERLWMFCVPSWADWNLLSQPRKLAYFHISGDSRRCDVSEHYVQVGCQRVNRYELEQLALNQGWKFP